LRLSWSTNLRNRLIVGFTGGPLLLIFAVYGHLPFLAVVAVILLLSLYEMHLMGHAVGIAGYDIPAFLFAAAILLDSYYSQVENLYLLATAYITIVVLISLFKDSEGQLLEVSYRCISTFYLSLFLSSLVLIREFPFTSGYLTGGKFIAVIFLGVWFLDTFAYFSGRMFGKHPLFPRISPKKTIEGSIGGVCGSVIIVAAAHFVFFPELSMMNTIISGVIIGVCGQLGDLIESFFKRKTGIKDSSAILPGHGGVLDRFDSLIFVSPFMYFYIKWIIAA